MDARGQRRGNTSEESVLRDRPYFASDHNLQQNSNRLKNIKSQSSGMRLPYSGGSADSVFDGELSMDDRGDQQIIPGISLSPTGQATVDPALADVLFDLGIQLEEITKLPVDVEHVLAAIVLAARNGQLNQFTRLSSSDLVLQEVLADYVRSTMARSAGTIEDVFRWPPW